MMKRILVKSLIAVGIIIWSIPFLSAVSVGLVFFALLWVKEKITFMLFTTSLN